MLDMNLQNLVPSTCNEAHSEYDLYLASNFKQET